MANFVHLISNKEWTATGRYALELCRALRADGHTVGVFTRRRPVVAEPIAREDLLHGVMTMRGPMSIVLSPVTLASYVNKLEGRTVIHIHDFKDAVIAVNARRLSKNPEEIRIVATVHDATPAKSTPSQLNIYNGLDAIVFPSEFARDAFLSSNTEIDRGRLHVVRGSVAVEPFEGEKPAEGSVRLIFSDIIAKGKGLEVLIEALAKLKTLDWTLTVCGAGKGSIVMPIVRAARDLGINCRIDWKGNDANALSELMNAHIFVAPSVEPDPEALSVIEAMSQHCAIVATDCGIHHEILKDGENAMLVPPSDSDALAAALRKLLENPPLRQRLASNAASAFISSLSYPHFYASLLPLLH